MIKGEFLRRFETTLTQRPANFEVLDVFTRGCIIDGPYGYNRGGLTVKCRKVGTSTMTQLQPGTHQLRIPATKKRGILLHYNEKKLYTMNHYIKQNHLKNIKNTFLVPKRTKIDSGCVLLELFEIRSIPKLAPKSHHFGWCPLKIGSLPQKETASHSNHSFLGTF